MRSRPRPSKTRKRNKKAVAMRKYYASLRYEERLKQELKERSTFCELCLRKWPPGQAVTFSSIPSWNGLDPSEGQKKLQAGLKFTPELDGRSICATCWKIADMMTDFRKCYSLTRNWFKKNGCGLAEVDDNWISEETVESLDITHMIIKNHIERIDAALEKGKRNTENNFEELELKFEVDEIKIEPEWNDDEGDEAFDEPKNAAQDTTQPAEEESESEPILEPIHVTVYTCAQCSMKFDKKHGYSMHVNRCTGQKTKKKLYTCQICSANFKANKNLKYHMNRHRGIKPYSCRVKCNASFYSDYSRRDHERRCGSDPLVCPTCGVLKKTENDLVYHMKSHATEARIPCEKCGKMFKTTKCLQRHQSVHSDARDYPCEVCGKAFKSKYAANVHMRIHTQEKPFRCHVCDEGFLYKCLVKPHVLKCHAVSKQESDENC